MSSIKKPFFDVTNIHKFISLLWIATLLSSVLSDIWVFADTIELEDNYESVAYEQIEPGVVLVGLSSNEEVFTASIDPKVRQNTTLEKLGITSSRTLIEFDISDKQSNANTKALDQNVEKIVAVYLKDQDAKAVFDAITALSEIPGVVGAQPSYKFEFNSTIPNDWYFEDLWGLMQIDAPCAWDKITGNSDVVVGVADKGIDISHPDLCDNIWQNSDEIPDNGIDDDNNGYIDDMCGWDFITQTNAAGVDNTGHGTHVAGIIGAIGNNEEFCTGVCWDVKLASLKVSGEESFIDAIKYAKNNGIKIINASFGGYYGYNGDLVYLAIQNYDGLVIASAGNDNNYNDRRQHYPSGYDLPNIISVGATNVNDTYMGNYGNISVHLGAPGYMICTTGPNNSNAYDGGTSMAAAFVSGAAALLKSYRPDFTPLQIKETILESVDKISGLEDRYATGGRLNVNNMLNMASGDENYSLSTPNLTYNVIDNTISLNTVRLSAMGEFPSTAYMELNKYDSSDVLIDTISDFININAGGIGEYTNNSSLMKLNLLGEYIEVTVYRGKDKQEKIVSQRVHPITF